ncbi:putative 30 kda heat shock protein [Phaeomoniella chlamydospora]|uniref:Putative 30 kDa heat shock protein n=1 Tax=Phaeomoniella chlamydospora TaxID=158046 RepID=A0A0G2EXL2_PHACM|nr:putative 30 kda heat shock protein [Phaeomoniella chlamydospora]
MRSRTVIEDSNKQKGIEDVSSSSQQRGQRSLKPSSVTSLLLPLDGLKLEEEPEPEKIRVRMPPKSLVKEQAGRTKSTRLSPIRKTKQTPKYSYRGYQSNTDNEAEFTDLSGFIVDDEAELSHHDWSSASDAASPPLMASKPKRQLVRGRDLKKPKTSVKNPASVTEVIDPTVSPQKNKEIPYHSSQLDEDDVFGFSDDPKPEISTEMPRKTFNVLDDEPTAMLRFSPPRLKSPFKIPEKPSIKNEDDQPNPSVPSGTGFTTPPASPSKPKLNSPSKSRVRNIPMSPHRQSIDAFWSSDIINDWNDSYSPQKPPMTSPRKKGLSKFLIYSDDEENQHNSNSSNISTPSTSPRRRQEENIPKPQELQLSPSKLRKALLEEKRAAKAAREDFDATKNEIATSFLTTLDQRITSNRVSALSASTGGVKIIWSNTLRSTAGRASWRRTTKKLEDPPSSSLTAAIKTQVHHTASIELSTKILTTKARLISTLAHEFCHLANFMVSNVKTQPHGPSFKAWASKVTAEFANDPEYGNGMVQVTTKHDYEIEWKYVWVCGGEVAKNEEAETKGDRTSWESLIEKLVDQGCGTEYGRHSKSIDIRKHRCGKCKGGLVQVKPKPRKTATTKKTTRNASDRRTNGNSIPDTDDNENRRSKSFGNSIESTDAHAHAHPTATRAQDEDQIDPIDTLIQEIEIVDLND